MAPTDTHAPPTRVTTTALRHRNVSSADSLLPLAKLKLHPLALRFMVEDRGVAAPPGEALPPEPLCIRRKGKQDLFLGNWACAMMLRLARAKSSA